MTSPLMLDMAHYFHAINTYRNLSLVFLKTVFNSTFPYLYKENLYSVSHHSILITLCIQRDSKTWTHFISLYDLNSKRRPTHARQLVAVF